MFFTCHFKLITTIYHYRTLTFEITTHFLQRAVISKVNDSKLKTIGSNVFESNKLTNTGFSKLPSSLTSLATDAFWNNPDLTQITLTSPKDLTGWPNGGTVDGKTVVYER